MEVNLKCLLEDKFQRVTRKNTAGNANVLTISAQHGSGDRAEERADRLERDAGQHQAAQGRIGRCRSANGKIPQGNRAEWVKMMVKKRRMNNV